MSLTITSTINCYSYAIADYLILEVISKDDGDWITLDDIPKTIKLSFMEDELQLGGIVHFDSSGVPPALRKAEKSVKAIGHYTAFCLKNGRWYQFDRTCKTRKGLHRVSPQLVLYTYCTL